LKKIIKSFIKVGGIYTVLRSKAASSVKFIGAENYYCLGIWNKNFASQEVEFIKPVEPAIEKGFDGKAMYYYSNSIFHKLSSRQNETAWSDICVWKLASGG
jgi:hypothetical protein